jgi:hypothetical protein
VCPAGPEVFYVRGLRFMNEALTEYVYNSGAWWETIEQNRAPFYCNF